ncbi:MAG: response regulator transcription factor [Cyanobacteria bacterium KgW148]|nr:response regulator transcription factor [Cyanobacteria bacterium KgW148]
MPATVQIVESNPSLGSLLQWHLQQANYSVYLTTNIHQAKEVFLSKLPQVVVIDTELADGDGLELCRWIFPQKRSVIMLISNRTKEADIVQGLQLGADDYLKKPFGLQEFLARIAVLARRSPAPPAILDFGSLTIDLIQRVVQFNHQTIDLSPQEFSLLYVLALAEGMPLPREELLQRAWSGIINNPRTIDTHVLSLRKKMHPSLIETVRNVGYRFNYPPV